MKPTRPPNGKRKQKRKTARLINQAAKLQKLASELGFNNIFQPGLLKEIVLAYKLGHCVHVNKHGADAYSEDGRTCYEYLTCTQNGTFQLDRMFKEPVEKRERSLQRITRNAAIYCAIYAKDDPLMPLEVYEVAPSVLSAEVERQLDASSNSIAHVSLSVPWVKQNGGRVYAN